MSVGEEIYSDLSPYAFSDEENELRSLVGALALPIEEIAEYARDSDDGPGWSELLDLERVPEKGLAWLAQFWGATIQPGLDRDHVLVSGQGRGTVAAILAAPVPYLTGEKTVTLEERADDSPMPSDQLAYHFVVTTLAAETPDEAPVIAALIRAKPAGLVLHYSTV